MATVSNKVVKDAICHVALGLRLGLAVQQLPAAFLIHRPCSAVGSCGRGNRKHAGLRETVLFLSLIHRVTSVNASHASFLSHLLRFCVKDCWLLQTVVQVDLGAGLALLDTASLQEWQDGCLIEITVLNLSKTMLYGVCFLSSY